MSLIDPRHLVAPLKNRIHLVSIVFIVLLFAVYRLSTGPAAVRQVPNSQQPPLIAPPAQKNAPARPLPGSAPSNDLNNQVQNLLTGQGNDAHKGAQPTDSSNLNDIEQALGIKK